MTLVSKLPKDRVALGPHETDEVALLMSIALDNFEVEVLPLARLVEQKAGGNPFFVKEVTRTMREKGVISFTEDGDHVRTTRRRRRRSAGCPTDRVGARAPRRRRTPTASGASSSRA